MKQRAGFQVLPANDAVRKQNMNYLNEDTIAALSTAAGKSAIAVVRISGTDAFVIIKKIFKTKSQDGQKLQYGFIFDAQNDAAIVDEVLCLFFKNPSSYTGEDMVEISCHGNPIIIDEILNLLYKNGARQAEGGEFTYRAFLNGKKDLAQAEAVCDLITSKTQTAAKAALNNISGGFSQKITNIKDKLVRFLAYLEASLDYPEEDDVPFLTPTQKLEMLEEIITANKKLLDAYKTSKILKQGLKAAIIGKPNTGKSSMLNAILGKNRAIVTEIAGTTTDTIEEVIDCRGIPLTIIDTAGIRNKSNNSIEVLGQQRTKETINQADIIIWLFDSSCPLDNNDFEIGEYIKNSGSQGKIFAVLNKIDITANPPFIKESDLPKVLIEKEALPHLSPLPISAAKNIGINELLDQIADYAGISDIQTDYLMLNSRHYSLLNNVNKNLIKIKEIILSKNADEIAAFQTRKALSSLEEILGINAPTDILDAIFSTFCIGK
jgi:tRNA modification GTPase